MKLNKCPLNPILKPNPQNDWESLCVLNPAVIYDEAKQEFVMFYRAAGNGEEHRIYLGLATSKDGVHFERKSDQPILSPDPDGADGGGIEDPRLIKLGDAYFMTYASRPFPPGQYWLPKHKDYVTYTQLGPVGYNRNDTQTHLAFSKDLLHWKKLGRITDHRDDDRDVIILPKKINGKYYRFSRPMYSCGEGYPNEKPAIWVTSSDDMLEWKEPIKLFYQGKLWWEGAKVGGSTPMIETADGWLFLYHGVSAKDHAYRVGAFLLDKEDPTKILYQTKEPILEPTEDYETKGYYNGCVFPTGNVVKDGILYVYYGAADHFIGLATIELSALLQQLKEEPYEE
ncbi:MAG: glycosidase [Bacilli bacterium]|nr:glycosidase [Bacilli bacterium]